MSNFAASLDAPTDCFGVLYDAEKYPSVKLTTIPKENRTGHFTLDQFDLFLSPGGGLEPPRKE